MPLPLEFKEAFIAHVREVIECDEFLIQIYSLKSQKIDLLAMNGCDSEASLIAMLGRSIGTAQKMFDAQCRHSNSDLPSLKKMLDRYIREGYETPSDDGFEKYETRPKK